MPALRADREKKQRTCIERHILTGGHRIQKPIIVVLREHEAGAKAGDLTRKHGISEATLYNRKVRVSVIPGHPFR
ncbi:hypothetical protein [Mesorhizobium sp. M0870]|uniref:hypothetical protein n=1 Tax=Mesorhizobium sp. M0870 TaxID=2957016 RepID=UPI00333CA3B5